MTAETGYGLTLNLDLDLDRDLDSPTSSASSATALETMVPDQQHQQHLPAQHGHHLKLLA